MAKSRGSVFWDDDKGSWCASVTIPGPAGSPRRRVKRVADSEADANETRLALLEELDRTGSIAPVRMRSGYALQKNDFGVTIGVPGGHLNLRIYGSISDRYADLFDEIAGLVDQIVDRMPDDVRDRASFLSVPPVETEAVPEPAPSYLDRFLDDL